MKPVIVKHNQSIWDLALQEYGDMSGAQQLIIDNPGVCDFENSIPAGTTVYVTGEPINKLLTDYVSDKKIVFATAIEIPYVPGDWILATGVWTDFQRFWRDNAKWID